MGWLEKANFYFTTTVRAPLPLPRQALRKELQYMMPLMLAPLGEECLIHKVGGSAEVKKHLEDLGFTAGSTVTLVSSLGGNVIVKVKESRIAISEEMARKIMV